MTESGNEEVIENVRNKTNISFKEKTGVLQRGIGCEGWELGGDGSGGKESEVGVQKTCNGSRWARKHKNKN